MIGGFSLASVLDECLIFGFLSLVWGMINDAPSVETLFFSQGPFETAVELPLDKVKPQ